MTMTKPITEQEMADYEKLVALMTITGVTDSMGLDRFYRVFDIKVVRQLLNRIRFLEAELAKPILDGAFSATRKCKYCGKQSRVTTAGCDHCDVEDK